MFVGHVLRADKRLKIPLARTVPIFFPSASHPNLETSIPPRWQRILRATLHNRGHSKSFTMARGNQRDKAREANQKKMADQVHKSLGAKVYQSFYAKHFSYLQKKGNSMTGSEMQREKEKVAAKMREKQAAGES